MATSLLPATYSWTFSFIIDNYDAQFNGLLAANYFASLFLANVMRKILVRIDSTGR
jgi:hypothetical protein